VWRQILGHAALQRPGGGRWRRWIEPFYGCGVMAQAAISLGLANEYHLADLCAPLVVAHRTLALMPQALLARLALLAPRPGASPAEAEHAYHTAAGWMRHHCRALALARGALLTDLTVAARFFLLLGSNFNGLWRVNRDGEYNVPVGRRSASAPPLVYQLDAARAGLLAQNTALRQPGVALVCADMLTTIESAGAGDVVYSDPPYCGTHSAYTAGKFPLVLHAELARALRRAAARGAVVLLSNSTSPQTLEIYHRPGDNVCAVLARRSGGRTAASRGTVQELLIHMRG
jgi:DNA adenine methylase